MPLHPKSRRRSSRISPLPDEDSLSFINSSVENLDQSPFESIDDLVEDVNKYDLKKSPVMSNDNNCNKSCKLKI